MLNPTSSISSAISNPGLLEFDKVDWLISWLTDIEREPNRKISNEEEQLLREIIVTKDEGLLNIIENYFLINPYSSVEEIVERIKREELEASRKKEDPFWLED